MSEKVCERAKQVRKFSACKLTYEPCFVKHFIVYHTGSENSKIENKNFTITPSILIELIHRLDYICGSP